MPESIRPEKNILSFNQGLNTESSEISFPDGFSTDERNYELLLDGSRRRRKGLAQESGGSDKDLGSACTGANQTYVWENVAGDPDKTFIVHKFGSTLYFTDDAETISTTYHTTAIELDTYEVTTSSVSMDEQYAQFAAGRGYLIVTGSGINPIIITYDPDTDDFTTSTIDLRIRDYSDQDDGFQTTQYPATLSDETRYNLLNRGWTDTNITLYYTDAGSTQYPNKSVAWHKGIIRTIVSGVADEDGTKSFSHTKYTAEPTSASSAPLGSLIIRPLDSGYANSSGEPVVNVTGLSINTTTWVATITTDVAHGLTAVAPDTFQLNDTSSEAFMSHPSWGEDYVWTKQWDGVYTVLSGSGTTLTCQFSTLTNWDSWIDEEKTLGTLGSGGSGPIIRPSGSALSVGPRACAFHDGRAFYAGINDNEWSDYVFFSQVPDKIDRFGKCYQVADPTDPENNQLVDTDGGWFAIQGIQGVKKMLSVRNMLLVFAENGVWEIGGGQRGFFTPSGYSIRKITEVGCDSPLSPIAVQNTAFYTGPEGVFQIAPNQYTGILEATSASKQVIQTKWNAIPEAEKRRVLSVYDDAKQLIFFLYGKAAASGYYDEILILDIEIPAWYYYSYNQGANTGILSAYAISYTDTTEQPNKIKFSVNVTDTDTVRTCDHNQTDYIDFDGAESPLPYVVTGWDNLGDFQRRRQAPVITVYSKRTETGYTDTGSGWTGDNESSNLMTAYWDWTDDSVSNKIGDQQETYRHTRAFTPSGASDVDGYPVVVTRNKVRGRGRVLQLRFDGAATKDSHIMGFTVNYRAQRAY